MNTLIFEALPFARVKGYNAADSVALFFFDICYSHCSKIEVMYVSKYVRAYSTGINYYNIKKSQQLWKCIFYMYIHIIFHLKRAL